MDGQRGFPAFPRTFRDGSEDRDAVGMDVSNGMLHAMPAQHRDELDPDIARLLQLRDATNAPPVQTMTPTEARAWADRMFGPPERAWPMPHIEDRSIPGPDGDLRVRLYHPAPGRTRPLVIFFHGGGWVLSSVDSYDAVARRLCLEADAAVVSVEYRLAPEHPFPAAPDDAIAATRHPQRRACFCMWQRWDHRQFHLRIL